MRKIIEYLESSSIQKKLFWISLAAIFVLMFILNHYVYMMHDDYVFSILKYGESFQFPDTFVDIYDFLIFYYFSWGGRVIAHLIVNILLLFSPTVQDVLNTLGFVALLYVIYSIINRGNSTNAFVLISIFCFVFLFIPVFVLSAVWITGSANYMWTVLIALYFVLFYYNVDNGEDYKDRVLRIISMFFLGVIAGNTNENVGPILVIITILYCYLFYRQKKLPKWAIAGLIGVFIGCAAMIFAPGNAVRAEVDGYSGLFTSLNNLPQKIIGLIPYYRYYLFFPLIIFTISLILFLSTYKGDKKKQILFNSLLFFITANISLWSTVLSPSFPPRAFGSITIWVLISAGILYANSQVKTVVTRLIYTLVLIVILGVFSIEYFKVVRAYKFVYDIEQKRIEKINECKIAGIDSVNFERIKIDYRYGYIESGEFRSRYYGMNIDFFEPDNPRLEKNNEKKAD